MLPFMVYNFPEEVKNIIIKKLTNQMMIIVGALITGLLIEKSISKNLKNLVKAEHSIHTARSRLMLSHICCI